ncbi:MAG: hypothetical protein OM95_00360 [Bdellovibrio sp. ArHS]|uniref:hypothetical protein n=1 Tax=Bdellovibrio sp. ArHS TaxID=1569284 RepID=UPI0005827CEF|nr:hypothetical protein [Bdellovibrio sp. ArHS]KHD90015.1 MAG: hypothetical protein OM95_00360 [Bdellovibrio sp. ArHS]
MILKTAAIVFVSLFVVNSYAENCLEISGGVLNKDVYCVKRDYNSNAKERWSIQLNSAEEREGDIKKPNRQTILAMSGMPGYSAQVRTINEPNFSDSKEETLQITSIEPARGFSEDSVIRTLELKDGVEATSYTECIASKDRKRANGCISVSPEVCEQYMAPKDSPRHEVGLECWNNYPNVFNSPAALIEAKKDKKAHQCIQIIESMSKTYDLKELSEQLGTSNYLKAWFQTKEKGVFASKFDADVFRNPDKEPSVKTRYEVIQRVRNGCGILAQQNRLTLNNRSAAPSSGSTQRSGAIR